jgi:hypothetical protein
VEVGDLLAQIGQLRVVGIGQHDERGQRGHQQDADP